MTPNSRPMDTHKLVPHKFFNRLDHIDYQRISMCVAVFYQIVYNTEIARLMPTEDDPDKFELYLRAEGILPLDMEHTCETLGMCRLCITQESYARYDMHVLDTMLATWTYDSNHATWLHLMDTPDMESIVVEPDLICHRPIPNAYPGFTMRTYTGTGHIWSGLVG